MAAVVWVWGGSVVGLLAMWRMHGRPLFQPMVQAYAVRRTTYGAVEETALDVIRLRN